MMNIVVIGLGSMGKRRIRLIQKVYPEFPIYGIDQREDRRKEVEQQFQIPCFEDMDSVEARYDIQAAFVCTAPLAHNSIIHECLKKKWHVFTELNLVADGYEENMALAEKMRCKLFLSSTFFYREEIKYIREYVEKGDKWNYCYHIGQYLPDWHPWEAYKDFFIGDVRTNGCREIMAIELPWLVAAFGKIKEFHVMSDRLSGLNIEYNDNYMIQFVHENGSKGTLIVDVVSPVAVRHFEAYRESEYIRWNGTPDSLEQYDTASDQLKAVGLNEVEEHKEGYRAFVVENAYANEIREFFDVVLNEKEPQYGFKQDKEILKLIDKLETKR